MIQMRGSGVDKPLLLAIVGPTASGKSALGTRVALEYDGEIVNCDSMQVMEGLDIGTAKPSPEQRQMVPHHLYDVVAPSSLYSAGRYMQEARAVCQEVSDRGHLPVVVGGTGLYLDALLNGIFEGPGRSDALRERFEAVEQRHGRKFLYRMLQRLDPESARAIQAADQMRVVRALEVFWLSGAPLSQLKKQRVPLNQFRFLLLVLNPPRANLYERINRRVEHMFEEGFVEEVEGLLAAGYSPEMKGFEALGYRQVLSYLNGTLGIQEAIEETQRDTRRYAKRQLTWFRKAPDMIWLPFFGDSEEAFQQVSNLLGGGASEVPA